jgi:hypothetical protein
VIATFSKQVSQRWTLGLVFPTGFAKRPIKLNLENLSCAGIVRGDGKGTQCPGVYPGHLVPGAHKYGDLALQVQGVSRIGTIKYGHESCGTPERDYAGENQQRQ